MKRKLFLILLSNLTILSWSFAQKKSVKLIIDVDNISNTTGKNVSVGIFDKVNFPTAGKAIIEKKIAATSGIVSITFDLPEGEYAVAVYHDLNANNKLDKNFFGIPKEPYGFSKNFKPTLSAPNFKDCSITLDEKGRKISISLIQ